MGELREIVDLGAVSRLFTLLALLLPLLGAVIGAGWGRHAGNNIRQGAVNGLVIGLLGPLNWVLWRLFNALTDHNGLDTVRNVVINLLVFVVVGLIIGVGAGRMLRQPVSVSEKPMEAGQD